MRIRTLLMTASVAALGIAGAASADDNDLVIQQLGDQGFAFAPQIGDSNETLIVQDTNTVANGVNASVAGSRTDVLVIQETDRNFVETIVGNGGNNNRVAVLQTAGNRNVTLGPNVSGGNGSQFDNSSFASVQTGARNVVNGGGERPLNSLPAGSLPIPDIATLGDIDGGLIPNGLPAGGGSGHSVFAGSNNFVALGQIGDDNRFGVMVDGNNNSIIGTGTGTLTSVNMNLEATNKGASGTFFDKGLGDAEIDVADATLSNGTGFGGGLATQEGFDNVAHLVQQGDNNTIAFNQLSDNNSAQIYQQGNLNVASATQD